MKNLIITEKDLNNKLLPHVVLDKDAEVFKIYGTIFEEYNVISSHFDIIFNWLKNYLIDANEFSNFYLCFNKPNTYAIQNWIIRLLYSINEIPVVKIYWLFEEGDYDTEEDIEDLIIETKINIIAKKISKEELIQFKVPYYLPEL